MLPSVLIVDSVVVKALKLHKSLLVFFKQVHINLQKKMLLWQLMIRKNLEVQQKVILTVGFMSSCYHGND